jgi:hypothetical protein
LALGRGLELGQLEMAEWERGDEELGRLHRRPGQEWEKENFSFSFF